MSARGGVLSLHTQALLGRGKKKTTKNPKKRSGLFTSSRAHLSVHIKAGINPPPAPQPSFTQGTNGHLSGLHHNETGGNHIRASALQLTGLTITADGLLTEMNSSNRAIHFYVPVLLWIPD